MINIVNVRYYQLNNIDFAVDLIADNTVESKQMGVEGVILK